MDHVQVRFPTNVEDVGRVIYDLTRMSPPTPAPLMSELPTLPPILHYSTPAAPMTKYDMTVIIAKHLGLPIDHVVANTQPAIGQAAAQRPENSQLGTKKLKEIGVDVGESEAFGAWWKRYAEDIKRA